MTYHHIIISSDHIRSLGFFLSIDWFKGHITGNSHEISWANLAGFRFQFSKIDISNLVDYDL